MHLQLLRIALSEDRSAVSKFRGDRRALHTAVGPSFIPQNDRDARGNSPQFTRRKTPPSMLGHTPGEIQGMMLSSVGRSEKTHPTTLAEKAD